MQVTKEIKGGKLCQECGKCCKYDTLAWLDYLRLYKNVSLTDSKFILKQLYILKDIVDEHWPGDTYMCMWLCKTKNSYRCAIYPNRPDVCKSFKCDMLDDKLRNKK